MGNYVFIAESLDGFIADSNGGIDWLIELENPENTDYGYNEFIEKIDAIVMGRNSFEKVLTFDQWPYTRPVFVLSSRPLQLPERLNNVIWETGNPVELIERLNSKGYKNIYVDGGKTIQTFLQYDLIDEMIISRIPILLGSGIPLFGYNESKRKFTHINTEVFANGLVKSHYKKLTE